MRAIFVMLCAFGLMSFGSCADNAGVVERDPPVEVVTPPLGVGYSLAISKFTAAKLNHAKSAGITYVEASGMGLFVDDQRNFKMTDAEIIEKLTAAKNAADAAGIDVWSVHMPFGQNIDLSLGDEAARQHVVAMHQKLLGFLKILDPEIILFHPSYYLGLNERDMRKSQMLKSAVELDESVREIGATMVIENMLGPELLAGSDRERPLMRSVEETQELFQRLPGTIYSAIDMNHIKNPERLIRAMGARLKSVHIADGSGAAENHYFPCSGEGANDWPAILGALEEVGYAGPFLYESAFSDEQDLVKCYQTLYNAYIQNKK